MASPGRRAHSAPGPSRRDGSCASSGTSGAEPTPRAGTVAPEDAQRQGASLRRHQGGPTLLLSEKNKVQEGVQSVQSLTVTERITGNTTCRVCGNRVEGRNDEISPVNPGYGLILNRLNILHVQKS